MLTGLERDRVVRVPTDSSARLVLGLDSFFGPVSSFELELDHDSQTEQVALTETSSTDATSALLEEISRTSRMRANRFSESETALAEAGFACIASGDFGEARMAFARVLEINPNNRRAILGLARAEKEIGNPTNAVKLLRNLLNQQPDDAEARAGLALALLATNSTQEAIAVLDISVAPNRRNASVFAARGALRLAMGDVRAAVSDLRKAVNARPDWVHARNVLGIAEARSGNLRAAERRFREAVRLGPGYVEAVTNLVAILSSASRWTEVLDLIERYWSPLSAPLALAMHAAEACFEIDNPRGARAWLEGAREKAVAPAELATLLNNLGVAYDRMGKRPEAISRFFESVETKPTDFGIANSARVLLDQGQPAVALEWLESWATPAGNVVGPASLQILANVYVQLNRVEEAVRSVQLLLQRPDANAEAYALWSYILADGAILPDDAVEAARRGLIRWPANSLLLNNLAYALITNGRIDEAEQIVNHLLKTEVKPDLLVYATATTGLCKLHRGDLASGWNLYERAAALAGRETLRERVKIKRDLEFGRALVRENRLREAEPYLRRASMGGSVGSPYTRHASEELQRLRSRISAATSDA